MTKTISHYEVILGFVAVASFKDRFDAASFVRQHGGMIRMITKSVQRRTDWWIQS